MELKEYIKIFKKDFKFFVLVVAGLVIFGTAFQELAPEKYRVEANLDITRSGQQAETSDYRYDEFYRLQADERFADTVVRWIGSERIREDISAESKSAGFEKLKAERLSSQLVRITFVVSSAKDSEKVTVAVTKVLNDKTQELNEDQKNSNWFKIIVSDPVVSENRIPMQKFVITLLFLGIFIGFWTVLIRHYLN